MQPQPAFYLALPPSGKGPGVLVLHAWWGLTDQMRHFCDRLAQEGFVALAPDLFHGQIARTVEEAERLVTGADDQQTAEAVLAALEELQGLDALTSSQVGVAGFSFGAYRALWLAQERPEHVHAVAIFYGTGQEDHSRSKAAYLGHFAGEDPFEPASEVQRLEEGLKSAGRPVTFYTYPGTGHWFFEEDRPDAYQSEAARQAWERTVSFFRDQLSG